MNLPRYRELAGTKRQNSLAKHLNNVTDFLYQNAATKEVRDSAIQLCYEIAEREQIWEECDEVIPHPDE